MSVLYPSSIRLFFILKPRHYVFSNASSSKRETTFLPNDDVLPTADVFTERVEKNILPNGALLPNSTHRSVSTLYQFLVLTLTRVHGLASPSQRPLPYRLPTHARSIQRERERATATQDSQSRRLVVLQPMQELGSGPPMASARIRSTCDLSGLPT
jgi:hypothetical protein